ncbi:DegT/DnrJ/EryC1/StrS family aminotransferase [Pseudomonas sp. Env-44]|jgi:dTDP-4-amino-4,6-dideoxygalactose transaminase|uniref:DegT/DnrJ/EryC1/StrS family aminotransferase n=1 Tax=unclassified Pseudomonas TaxID=196821 RepID=UPI000CD3B659|nr:PLP-dependent aminotransferase [Pseudomonas fluorescens]
MSIHIDATSRSLHTPAGATVSWPKWPSHDSDTLKIVSEVLESTRWTISGAYTGQEAYERRFARAFADYCGTLYCTPVTSGTSALTISLLALEVGAGDEVLVPGLTWVACASATCSVGAVPVLVDIDPMSLSMSPQAAQARINAKTKAILLVHPYCRTADIDAFLDISERYAIPLIEDCSQAHGAMWRGRKVGSFGALGCFSMQQAKVLTSGEGGAVVTSDPVLAEKLEQLRADGRLFSGTPVESRLELVERGAVQGQNFCLTEFQSAILLDRLQHLDQQNTQREACAETLRALFEGEEDFITFLRRDPRNTRCTYYNLVMKVGLEKYFPGCTIDALALAMTQALNVQVSPLYQPMNSFRLYNPLSSPRIKNFSNRLDFEPARYPLPQAESARLDHITLPNWVLLGGADSAHRIAMALRDLAAQPHKVLAARQAPTADAF